jgi:hypothetical protein
MKERSRATLSFCQSLWAAVEELLAIAQDARGHAATDRHGGQVAGNDRASAHDGAFANRNTRGDDYISAQPHIIADGDGRVAAGLFANELAPGDAVIGRDDGCAGPEQNVAANGDCPAWRRPDGAQVIDEAVIADVDLLRILEKGVGEILTPLPRCCSRALRM